MHITTTLSVLGYLAGVIGAFILIFSRVKNENLKDLQERVKILEAERNLAQQQHLENQKAISNLEGQLATYKEIPLKSIASSLEKLSISNVEILAILQSSAIISQKEKNDGGILVKTRETNPLNVKVKE